MKKKNLNVNISVDDFKQQYWYLNELRDFAVTLKISMAKKLRKDELENEILIFLKTGKVSQELPKRFKGKKNTSVKDSQRGLDLSLSIINFTWDYVTKDFLEIEIACKYPGLAPKSGEKYWTQRWLEKIQEDSLSKTYDDLIDHLIELRTTRGRLPRIPSTRYNNFITDYLAAYPGSLKAEAQKSWEKLKELPIEKSFQAYAIYMKKKSNS